MRQTHAAGERLFVDYAGDGVPVVIDRLTGEIRMAQIFVAVLGASSFTFSKATWTQALPDWIAAHVRAFEAIGGVAELIVPDNARTAIVKTCFYDPEVNRTYADMAAHYGTVILPARPRKPRDKAKVEQAVLIVERWLLGQSLNKFVKGTCRAPSCGKIGPQSILDRDDSWIGRNCNEEAEIIQYRPGELRKRGQCN